MVLSVVPPGPSPWGREWPQQHQGGDYPMMQPTMMPYDTRQTASPPLQRPVMTNQYMVDAPYTTAPMTSMPTAQYQHQMAYCSQTSSPVGLSYPFSKQTMPTASTGYHSGSTSRYQTLQSPDIRGSPSPSTRSEASTIATTVTMASSVASSGPGISKTITSNIPINPELAVDHNTLVDRLMKAIQARPETDQVVEQAEREIKAEYGSEVAAMAVEMPSQEQVTNGKDSKDRMFICQVPGCHKNFTQNTHLTIHMRAHTGEKPHICEFCGKGFTQQGNLKTHTRRHTGEKPYMCTYVGCGRRFAQKGNLRAHDKTHLSLKPYACRFGDCNKVFTQRGNLKSHMNKFHQQIIEFWIAKFADPNLRESDLSESDKDMRKYLAVMYKNTNRGVKGRGQDSKVEKVVTPLQSTASSPAASAYHHSVPQHQYQHQPTSAPAQPQVYTDNTYLPPLYDMSRQAPVMNLARDPRGYYDAYNTSATSAPAPMYHEEDHRRAAYAYANDRMY